jgi:hypothetical protein
MHKTVLSLLVIASVAAAQTPATRSVPPARIVEFKANPTTIEPGKSVQLVWATENPNSVTIDPEVGKVTARGARMVKPGGTTIYTLTVTGPNGTVLTQDLRILVSGTATPTNRTALSTPETYNPRMPDGKPDLNGVYGFAGVRNATPPALKPGAEKFRIPRGQPGDVKGNTTLGTDCVPLGVPQAFVTPYPFQIVQTPKLLVMIFEYPNTFRMIPLDGRAHTPDPDPSWNGEAVAHWDGDALVVDTIGFNDRTEVSGFLHTEALHVMERYKRLDNGSLQYDVTVEDPNVWVAPWTLPQRILPYRSESEHVDEFVCESHVDYTKFFKKK